MIGTHVRPAIIRAQDGHANPFATLANYLATEDQRRAANLRKTRAACKANRARAAAKKA